MRLDPVNAQPCLGTNAKCANVLQPSSSKLVSYLNVLCTYVMKLLILMLNM